MTAHKEGRAQPLTHRDMASVAERNCAGVDIASCSLHMGLEARQHFSVSAGDLQSEAGLCLCSDNLQSSKTGRKKWVVFLVLKVKAMSRIDN